MGRLLATLLVVALGCHDLDAVPRVGEVDGAVRDLGPDFGPLPDVDLGPPRDLGSVDGFRPDMGTAALLPHYGATFARPFPVRGAVPHAGGVLIVGRDTAGDRSREREALAAFFSAGELSLAGVYGGDQNDQFVAVTARNENEAFAAGVTREFGSDDLLIGRFVSGSLDSLINVGTASDEQPADLTTLGDELILVGESTAEPAVFRVDASLEGSASVTRIDFGADGRFFGVAAEGNTVVAVGDTRGGGPSEALIAVLSLGTGGFEVTRAARLQVPGAVTRLMDVTLVDETAFVAVGDAGGEALVVRGDVTRDSVIVETASSSSGTWLSQVAIVGGEERYAGTDSGRAMVGRRVGPDLVFDRLPFNFLPLEGRVAHLGDDPFLVANNIGGGTTATSIYVASINGDGRPSCADRVRMSRFTPLPADEYVLTMFLGDSTTTALTVGTEVLTRYSDMVDGPVPDECPSP